MIDAAGGLLAVALRFAAYTATTGLIGAWVFGQVVLDRMGSAVAPPAREEWRAFARRTATWCAGVLALSALVRLFAPVVTVPGAQSGAVGLNAIATTWGATLVVQGVAAFVVTVALIRLGATAAWPTAARAGVIVLVIVPPFLAHAGTMDDHRVMSVIVDVVHGAAAGAWAGALALLTTTVLRERQSSAAPEHAAALIVAFHRIAVIAAPAVFLTGLATAWLRMGAPTGIASPTYSGLFVAKLLLVGVTGALGAGHSKLATRRVQAVALAHVGRTLLSESLIAVLVLMVTAVLVGTAPIG